jgi:hypothetical protein
VNSDIAGWLELLYGREPAGLIWIGGHGDGFAGRTFTAIGDAADYAAKLDASSAGGVYHRLTTLRPIERGRGAAADSAYLPGFAMDLDLKGPGHKAGNYPDSEEDLTTLLRKAGMPEPTVWVHSGGGRYPYWLLDQSVDLTLPGALENAARVSGMLHKIVMAWAADAGWKVDNTSDLARIYRLPGTHNRKTGSAVLAHVQSDAGPRYALGDIAEAVRSAPMPAEIDPGPNRPTPSEIVRDRPALSSEGSSLSSLFGGGQGAGVPRASVSYTLPDAMRFVAQALDKLRAAPDGEINNRLNDAAMAMAHFGEQFWSREAAEKQLYAALDATVYDGLTWLASDTIASAYRAMAARGAAGDAECWDAVLLAEWTVSPGGVVQGDEVDALLAEMLSPGQVADMPPPRYLIQGLLQFDSESWAIGPPGSKKSFVVLDQAAHVARGMPWQGRKVRQAPVVFIVAEGAGGMMPRVKAWEQRYGAMTGVHFLPRPVQVKDAHAWVVLVEACRRLGAGMVVVDTQARVTVGLEENSATDMGVYVDAVRAIKEATRACVLTVHHTGRKGGDARGSSAIDGAQTTELKVMADGDGEHVTLFTEKQKDIEPAAPIKLKFERVVVGQDEEGADITSLVLLPHDAWRQSEMDDAGLDAARDAEVVPFAVRKAVQPWTDELTHPNADLQRWLLQALADTAEDRGLTQSEWRGVVDEKLVSLGQGKTKSTPWRKAFQTVTGSAGRFGEVVVKIHGADRWTVDQVALQALIQALS